MNVHTPIYYIIKIAQQVRVIESSSALRIFLQRVHFDRDERAGAGYSLRILLSVREAEARVLHVPRCGRDSTGIAPYIALTVLFCPGCALKNNAVQAQPVRRLKLRRRASRECDLKIPFNFRRALVAPFGKNARVLHFLY